MTESIFAVLFVVAPIWFVVGGFSDRRVLFALLSTLIMVCFSEKVYWYTQGYNEGLVIGLIQFYFFPAFFCLLAIEKFRVRRLAPLFLCAAIYGLLAEGVLTPIVYEGEVWNPFHISYTALAWHAPLSVVFGWYGLRHLLMAKNKAPLIAACTLFGLFWGCWSTTFWLPENANDTEMIAEGFRLGKWPLQEFSLYAFSVTLVLALGHFLLGRGASATEAEEKPFPVFTLKPAALLTRGTWLTSFTPHFTLTLFSALYLLLWWALVTAPAVVATTGWLSLLKLPLALALALAGLWANRARETGPTLYETLRKTVPLSNLAWLLLMPISATLVYGLADLFALPEIFIRKVFHEGIVLITGWAGLGVFVLAIVACWIPAYYAANKNEHPTKNSPL